LIGRAQSRRADRRSRALRHRRGRATSIAMAIQAPILTEQVPPPIPVFGSANGSSKHGTGSRNRPINSLELVDGIAAVHEHCAVYTGPEAVDIVLDLVGWTVDGIDANARLLEPACGDGSFLLPAIARLIDWSSANPYADLAPMIRAYEFDARTIDQVRRKINALLRDHGRDAKTACELTESWVRCEDFLLATPDFAATQVVGNPPYMRWSLVPPTMRSAYEAKLPVAAARGDLCLAFIWKATEFAPNFGSRIGFLCADRWLRCAYGQNARAALKASHGLKTHIEVHGLPVFKGARKVGAYAAVTVLERGTSDVATRFGKATSLTHLRELATSATSGGRKHPTIWQTSSKGGARLAVPAVRALLDAIERKAPCLAEVGVAVRCGTALGLAKAFVLDADHGIEHDRALPYLRSRDLDDAGGFVSSTYVANVWTAEGGLLDLSSAPALAAHLEGNRERLEQRACVSGNGDWYRTIDKLHPDRVAAPKILIAGMAQRARISFDPGGHVASNALYCLTSTDWPLQALMAILKAGIVDLFGEVVSPRFSGGTKRFDGNVLRQVRLPKWSSLSTALRRRVEAHDATSGHDPVLVADLYGLRSSAQRTTLERTLASTLDASTSLGNRT